MDVDGTLTDGKIYISSRGEEFKAFNVKDGYGISNILSSIDVTPVIITGRTSDIVKKRADELDIKEVYQGISDKLSVLRRLCTKYSIFINEVAYIGDDVNDIPAMLEAGLSFAPKDSVSEVKKIADFILNNAGGQGAVRECIEHIVNINEDYS